MKQVVLYVTYIEENTAIMVINFSDFWGLNVYAINLENSIHADLIFQSTDDELC